MSTTGSGSAAGMVTPEQVASAQALLDELVSANPEPSLDRDRAAAQILGDNGLLIDQAELLLMVVADSGPYVNPADVAAIQRNYELLGSPDEAVEYGNWVNELLPAYRVALPVLPPLYVDPYANLRRQIYAGNMAIYERLDDSANAAATRAVLDELARQRELSLLPSMIVIAEGP